MRSASPGHAPMRTIRVHQVDAFTRRPLTGNPAGVVLDADDLAPAEMQAIARELNNSETAFVCRPTADDHDVWVRFFTPSTEVPLCGHATVAVHYVRAVLGIGPFGLVRQRSGVGVLPVQVLEEDGDYRVVMTQAEPRFSEPLDEGRRLRVLAALGMRTSDRDDRCPMEVVSTGAGKIMVGVRSRATLDALRPDMSALRALTAEIGGTGYFAFCLDSGDPAVLATGRMFAPAVGVPEDPVTGNAAAAFGAYCVRYGLAPHDGSHARLVVRQGEAMRRPGQVVVHVDIEGGAASAVRIEGEAVLMFAADLRYAAADADDGCRAAASPAVADDGDAAK